ncbi:MAG: DUF484 family protein [Gammaproteobacteria bacterium]
MTTQQKHGLAEGVSDKEVIEYLQAHPDFFITHTHLLADLVVPHESGGAVSLIERQVAVLRDQNRQVRRELADLVQIARDNDRLNECLQRFALAVMGCATLSEIFNTLYDTLRSDLNADAVALRLFGNGATDMVAPGVLPPATLVHPCTSEDAELMNASWVARDAAELEIFRKILEAGKPVCGRLSAAQLHYLFGSQAKDIPSAALLPLHPGGQEGSPLGYGMLAIGSHNGERFHPAMGTVFLSHLSALLSRALRPHLV